MGEIDFAAIQLLVLDVDGVLTDGKVILTSSGEEIKEFHVRDGSGMKYWRRAGKKLAIISGRGSAAVGHRAEDLGVDAVVLNAKEKLPAYEQVLKKLGVAAEQAAVMGDDLPDLPVMLRCALPIAPADAVEEVRRVASYVTKLAGGAGCVREAIELMLRGAGLWGDIVGRYSPKAREAE